MCIGSELLQSYFHAMVKCKNKKQSLAIKVPLVTKSQLPIIALRLVALNRIAHNWL